MDEKDFEHLPDLEKRTELDRFRVFETAIAEVPGVREPVIVFVAGLNAENHVVLSRGEDSTGRLEDPIAIDPQYIVSYRTY